MSHEVWCPWCGEDRRGGDCADPCEKETRARVAAVASGKFTVEGLERHLKQTKTTLDEYEQGLSPESLRIAHGKVFSYTPKEPRLDAAQALPTLKASTLDLQASATCSGTVGDLAAVWVKALAHQVSSGGGRHTTQSGDVFSWDTLITADGNTKTLREWVADEPLLFDDSHTQPKNRTLTRTPVVLLREFLCGSRRYRRGDVVDGLLIDAGDEHNGRWHLYLPGGAETFVHERDATVHPLNSTANPLNHYVTGGAPCLHDVVYLQNINKPARVKQIRFCAERNRLVLDCDLFWPGPQGGFFPSTIRFLGEGIDPLGVNLLARWAGEDEFEPAGQVFERNDPPAMPQDDAAPPFVLRLNPEAQATLVLDEDDNNRWALSGSSNGFWYDITSGGYSKPEKVLDAESAQRVREAIALVSEFEDIYNDFTAEF